MPERFIALTILFFLIGGSAYSVKAYDVIVYGATPSGISAAVNAAREGVSVALVEESDYIGGLTASGLSNTDFKSFESLGGTWLEFMKRVEAHYKSTYGVDSQQVKDSWGGAFYEPKVAYKVFMDMISAEENLSLILLHRLVNVDSDIAGGSRLKMRSVRFYDLNKRTYQDYAAEVFIDATYEGDLIAKAGVAYTVGSEGPEQYGEPSATPKDWHVQCYNFRMTLTRDPENRIPFEKPENYDPDEFGIILAEIEKGNVSKLDDVIRGTNRQIPNLKADFNDKKGSKQSIKICNETDVWPEGSPEVRKQIWQVAKDYTAGLLYFLQHDQRVPNVIREEMGMWGLPKDEFVEYGHWPPHIYVREGRRMIGQYVMTEHDGKPDQDSVRAPAHATAIAIADYSFNSHGSYYSCECCGDRVLLGNMSIGALPFQIPYGALLPENVDGLLAPVPVSASRIAYGAIRMEPTWTALGQASGIAAAMAVKSNTEVADINVNRLRSILHKQGAVTFYSSDVSPGSPNFRAVQYFGNMGMFQDMYDPEKVPPATREKLSPMTQWVTAQPYHDIKPDAIAGRALATRWLNHLEVDDAALIEKADSMTRGELLNALYGMLN